MRYTFARTEMALYLITYQILAFAADDIGLILRVHEFTVIMNLEFICGFLIVYIIFAFSSLSFKFTLLWSLYASLPNVFATQADWELGAAVHGDVHSRKDTTQHCTAITTRACLLVWLARLLASYILFSFGFD